MLLSIVIALYNTEKYIEKCINSVLYMSLLPSEFEIIVINDGSTDQSQSIVESMMFKHGNIKLINKKNGGQSSARNIGFSIAKGEYIFCLDSDDFVDSKLLGEALRFAIDKQLDMLPIGYIRVDEKGGTTQSKDTYCKFDGVISGSEFLKKFTISGAMCRYLYRTKIIKDNQLKLIEGIFHEDEEFVIRFLTHVKRISYNQLALYYYLDRSNSTIRKKDLGHRKKLIYDIITVIDSFNNIVEMSKDKELCYGIERKKQQLVLSIFLRMYKESFPLQDVKEIKNTLSSKGIYPLKSEKLNLKQKIASYFFNIPFLINILYKKKSELY